MEPTQHLKQKEAEPLVVITTIASFTDNKRNIRRRISPVRILRPSGQVHHIKRITNWYEEFVGHGHRHVHVTVLTEDIRHLDIVFDTKRMGWYLVHEEAGTLLD